MDQNPIEQFQAHVEEVVKGLVEKARELELLNGLQSIRATLTKINVNRVLVSLQDFPNPQAKDKSILDLDEFHYLSGRAKRVTRIPFLKMDYESEAREALEKIGVSLNEDRSLTLAEIKGLGSDFFLSLKNCGATTVHELRRLLRNYAVLHKEEEW